MTLKPYNTNQSKKEEVAQMFNNIAHRYDFLNHLFSLGIDKIWRKKAIRILGEVKPKQIIDLATGTGDLAFTALRLNPDHVSGVDISQGMLDIGKQKAAKRGVSDKVSFTLGDSENIPFESESFEGAMVAFGVRNFEHLDKGLEEINRVLKPGGRCVVLEFSKPTAFPIKQVYWFYFKAVMPTVGKWFSKDSRAYTYLPESVKAFPDGDDFLDKYYNAGFKDVRQVKLTGGIASLYIGEK